MRSHALAVTVLASAALFASIPAAASAQTGTATTGSTGTTQTTQAKARLRSVVYGRITELASDHITIKPDNGDARRIRLADKTRFVALNYAAAHQGIVEGDFAAAIAPIDPNAPATSATVADDTTTASAVIFDTKAFRHAHSGNVRIAGRVADSNPNSLKVLNLKGEDVTVLYNQSTKFYVNGKLEQNPPAFKAGDPVAVLADKDSNGVLTALAVRVRQK